MTWLQSTRDRRQVLGAAARGAAAGLLSRVEPGSPGVASAQTETPAYVVRQSVDTLDLDGPEVASLRKAVARMRQISEDDPEDHRGWLFQSQIHGAPDGIPHLPYWRQCQHGSYFFFPWHRMFLYWFERILRWAAEDPELALPYWDYSVPARQRLPIAFREPADASNPLYLVERAPDINAGASAPSEDVFDHGPAFVSKEFTTIDPLDTCFGGSRVTAPVHFGGRATMGLLEGTPHGQIHLWIGGLEQNPDGTYRTAWMGDLNFAARDPIFWLHHANIDRLWDRWLEQGEGRTNPTDDPVWMTTSFTFFDEDGDTVTMAAEDVLDTMQQLGYLYDDSPLLIGRGPAPEGEPEREGEEAPTAGGEPQRAERRRRSLLGSSRAGRLISLGPTPTTVPIRRDATTSPTPSTSTTGTGSRDRIVLTIDGVRGLGVPGVTFEVYLHSSLDSGAPPPDSFVGLLNLFGLQTDAMTGHEQPAATQSFDVTQLVRTAMADPMRRGRLAATFVPRVFGTVQGPPGPWATVERVAVSTG